MFPPVSVIDTIHPFSVEAVLFLLACLLIYFITNGVE